MAEDKVPMHTDEGLDTPQDSTMSDVEKSKYGFDSDSESDSDDENSRIKTLEDKLNTDPTDYDLHLQYIRALRKEAKIEKLRTAREAMNELYPFTPAMWQEWISDEITLNSGSDAFNAIEKLYERGIFDYVSVSLWLEYINFVIDHDPLDFAPAGIQKLRNLFERAVSVAGLHIPEGRKLWEAYRKFEQQLLDSMDKTNIEPREKQVQLICKIFHRQLSVPLQGLDSTLLAYKSWEAEQGTSIDVNGSNLEGTSIDISLAYEQALKTLSDRAHYEELVSKEDSTDSERLQQYMEYLNIEQSLGDPRRAHILYERAIAEYAISADLWLNYTEYMDRTVETTETVKDIYCRATRNCPWVGDLWVRYLLALERIQSSDEVISDVFEKSLRCTFSSIDEYLNIFLTRVDNLRRKISSAGGRGTAVEFARIRDTFQRASDYLSPQMYNTPSLLHMYCYWGNLEAYLAKDIGAARRVWEKLLASCGNMCEAWQSYIAMEIRAGHINNARSLYDSCYRKGFLGTGSEDICNSWIRFEREFGTLKDFDHAVQKVSRRLAELQLYRSEQVSKQEDVSAV